jgi:hypothetical protein
MTRRNFHPMDACADAVADHVTAVRFAASQPGPPPIGYLTLGGDLICAACVPEPTIAQLEAWTTIPHDAPGVDECDTCHALIGTRGQA